MCEGLDEMLCGSTKVRAADLGLPWESCSARECSCWTGGGVGTVVGCTSGCSDDTVGGTGFWEHRVPAARVRIDQSTVWTGRDRAWRQRIVIGNTDDARAGRISWDECLLVD